MPRDLRSEYPKSNSRWLFLHAFEVRLAEPRRNIETHYFTFFTRSVKALKQLFPLVLPFCLPRCLRSAHVQLVSTYTTQLFELRTLCR